MLLSLLLTQGDSSGITGTQASTVGAITQAAAGAVAGVGLGLRIAQSTNTTTSSQTTTGGTGSALIVLVADGQLASDSKGNTYTAGPTITSGQTHRSYYVQNFTGGSGHTWTVSGNSGVATATIIVIELINVGSITVGAWKTSTAGSSAARTANAATVGGTDRALHLSVSDASGTVTWTRTDGLSMQAEVTNGATAWAAHSASGVPSAGTFTAAYTISDTAASFLSLIHI